MSEISLHGWHRTIAIVSEDPSIPKQITRLAPSPTGAVHLGNARTFLVNWALARRHQWRVVLRIEDIDHPRVKPETIDSTRRDLEWLGLTWDEEVPLQSTAPEAAWAALQQLADQGLVYPCTRTRAEFAASAPNEGDGVSRASASLRPETAGAPCTDVDEHTNWRLLVGNGTVEVNDLLLGANQIDVAADCGDFAVWTKRGVPAYQLAVAVDDARQGVTQVVRGNDLLPSAARQTLLLQHLNLPIPTWWHVPLLRGEDGRRLAKRHGDSRIGRWQHDSPDRLIGLLASWSGISQTPEPMSADAFADAFDLETFPTEDVVVREADLTWLD